MEINTDMLFGTRLLASMLIIVAVIAASVMRHRRSITHVKTYALIGSALILNSALQLPGRSLSGADGLIAVLNLALILTWLIGLNLVLWKGRTDDERSPNEMKCNPGEPK